MRCPVVLALGLVVLGSFAPDTVLARPDGGCNGCTASAGGMAQAGYGTYSIKIESTTLSGECTPQLPPRTGCNGSPCFVVITRTAMLPAGTQMGACVRTPPTQSPPLCENPPRTMPPAGTYAWSAEYNPLCGQTSQYNMSAAVGSGLIVQLDVSCSDCLN